MTIVYVDVLLVLNFMVNMVLIRAAVLLSGVRFAPRRTALAAAVGALSALVIFLPFYGVFVMGCYKLVFCIAMAFIAFGYQDLAQLARDVFCLFAVSFLFSGLMLGLYVLATPRGMTVYNGVVYFDISAMALLIVTGVSYLVTLLLAHLLRRGAPAQLICTVTVTHKGVSRQFLGLIDTGNRLTEPFSGAPVMVCGAQELEGLLPAGFLTGSDPMVALELGLRLIPFSSIGGRGTLFAFQPDHILLSTPRGNAAAPSGCYLALSPEAIGNAQYQAILGSAMVDGKLLAQKQVEERMEVH